MFFAAVTASHGDWATGFRHALLVVTAFVLIALCAAAADLFAGHRPAKASRTG